MNATAIKIFAALDAAYTGITATASALGISKQAYSIARQRGNLSDELCIRAAAALGMDSAVTLLELHRDNAGTPEARAQWESILERITRNPDAGAGSTTEGNNDSRNDAGNDTTQEGEEPTTNYAFIKNRVKPHFLPLSKNHVKAERLARWMVSVPKISPASPRFVYYADNWNVLYKIQRFTDSGEFESITKDGPAFSAEEFRAALDYINRSETIDKPQNATTSTPQLQALAR